MVIGLINIALNRLELFCVHLRSLMDILQLLLQLVFQLHLGGNSRVAAVLFLAVGSSVDAVVELADFSVLLEVALVVGVVVNCSALGHLLALVDLLHLLVHGCVTDLIVALNVALISVSIRHSNQGVVLRGRCERIVLPVRTGVVGGLTKDIEVGAGKSVVPIHENKI